MRSTVVTLAVPLAAVSTAVVAARTLRRWGATPAEQIRELPGDDVIPGACAPSTMATTIDAPPEAVWPWLAQMGCDRAGFYSWDRLDNGGRPSATELHDEWQDVVAGSRIMSIPGGRAWFTVVRCDAPFTLVLRASMDLRGRPFDPDEPPPRYYSDGVWGFHLHPLPGGRTRLLVRSQGRGAPAAFTRLSNALFWEPAHWVMQTKQFRGLRRRASTAPLPDTRSRAAVREVVPAGT